MDKYVLLYVDDRGVRHIVEVPVEDRVEFIGISRYTEFDNAARTKDSKTTNVLQNGSYPIIKHDIFNDVYGKVLTVCDAAFPSGDQKDAFKSLIKNTLSDWYEKQVGYTATMTDQLVDLENK